MAPTPRHGQRRRSRDRRRPGAGPSAADRGHCDGVLAPARSPSLDRTGPRPWAPDQEVTMARDPTRADERRPATAAPAVSRRSARQRRSRPRLRRALRRMVAMARRLERGARTATPIPAACLAGRARRKLGGQRLVSARASPVRTPSTAVSGLRRSSTPAARYYQRRDPTAAGRCSTARGRPCDRCRDTGDRWPHHRVCGMSGPAAAVSRRSVGFVASRRSHPGLSPQQHPPPDRSTVRGSAATAARPASRRRSSWLDEASPRPGLAVAPRGTDDAAATATTSCRCSPASSGRSRPPCRTAG